MIWEVGVLLMGVGILILCIFTATTIRDLGGTIKRIERILADKNGEIETIINKSASITNSVDGIVTNVNKATNVVGIVTAVSAGIASKFKHDNQNEDMGQEDLDDNLNFDQDIFYENVEPKIED